MIHCTDKEIYDKYLNELKVMYKNRMEQGEDIEKTIKGWIKNIDKFRTKAENFILA